MYSITLFIYFVNTNIFLKTIKRTNEERGVLSLNNMKKSIYEYILLFETQFVNLKKAPQLGEGRLGVNFMEKFIFGIDQL